jgi:hypothetical protein
MDGLKKSKEEIEEEASGSNSKKSAKKTPLNF